MTLFDRLAYFGLGLLTLTALYAGYAFHAGDDGARAWITPLCMVTAAAAILLGHRCERSKRFPGF
jgi:hypothetical protein